MPLIPALGRQRQMDVCEFEVSVVEFEVCEVESVSFQDVKVTQKNPASGKIKNKIKK